MGKPIETYEVIAAMRFYGGGFVKALATAAELADAEQLRGKG